MVSLAYTSWVMLRESRILVSLPAAGSRHRFAVLCGVSTQPFDGLTLVNMMIFAIAKRRTSKSCDEPPFDQG
jgi:hypothetical protein